MLREIMHSTGMYVVMSKKFGSSDTIIMTFVVFIIVFVPVETYVCKNDSNS